MSAAFSATFRVFGDPKGQPRPKAARHGGFTRVYDPGTANSWKEAVVIAARPHAPPEPLRSCIRFEIDLYLARPASRCRKRDPDGPIWAPKKPDSDNAEKAIWDALVQAGFLADDAFICHNETRKMYTAKNGAPGALITIERLETVP